jgi:hypothetical protein
VLRRKGENWLTRNQDNVFKLGDMSTRGLFCQGPVFSIKPRSGVIYSRLLIKNQATRVGLLHNYMHMENKLVRVVI